MQVSGSSISSQAVSWNQRSNVVPCSYLTLEASLKASGPTLSNPVMPETTLLALGELPSEWA